MMIQPLGFESEYKLDLMLIDPAELSKEPSWTAGQRICISGTDDQRYPF
ncbi:MAG: hypothetical protein AAFR12_19995 [Cyanobacteria bacterium J06626_6]